MKTKDLKVGGEYALKAYPSSSYASKVIVQETDVLADVQRGFRTVKKPGMVRITEASGKHAGDEAYVRPVQIVMTWEEWEAQQEAAQEAQQRRANRAQQIREERATLAYRTHRTLLAAGHEPQRNWLARSDTPQIDALLAAGFEKAADSDVHSNLVYFHSTVDLSDFMSGQVDLGTLTKVLDATQAVS